VTPLFPWFLDHFPGDRNSIHVFCFIRQKGIDQPFQGDAQAEQPDLNTARFYDLAGRKTGLKNRFGE
jgi:hypothetical protein